MRGVHEAGLALLALLVVLLAVSVLLSAFCGCGRDRCTEPVCWDDVRRIAFAVTAYNPAWAGHYSGFYIDWGGAVFGISAWDESADSLWAIEEDGLITLTEIAVLESHWENVNTVVNKDSVEAMLKLLKYAAKGSFLDHPRECADCGVWHYLGLMRDCERGGYRPVLLYQGGEDKVTNESHEARRLYEWLDRVLPGLLAPCGPHND